jgi:hypothetical protein
VSAEARKRGEETVENLRELRAALEAKLNTGGLTSAEMGELCWLRAQPDSVATEGEG